MSPPRPSRLVLDTNFLLSALLFQAGSLSWLRGVWQSGAIVPLASRATTAELLRVLAYPKFQLSTDEREDLLADYLPWCETVTVDGPVTVPDCRDPHDRPFLELAIFAGADALITGDKDLLVLAESSTVPILTPAAFRARLG
ncbi:MAG: putative toxin-antitoxin system toxin component, PIN family [Alphaproteobacteria bacterium]|jgi:putative PIN family toxin of toxin-antitoxin system|nr:putative toxin-antitoxin system toxin component, PIN family [Alphaproteobacteria bacterium]